jgi:hypothetical protein
MSRQHRGKRNPETIKKKKRSYIEWQYVFDTAIHAHEPRELVCSKEPGDIKSYLEIICNNILVNRSEVSGVRGLVLIDAKEYEQWCRILSADRSEQLYEVEFIPSK